MSTCKRTTLIYGTFLSHDRIYHTSIILPLVSVAESTLAEYMMREALFEEVCCSALTEHNVEKMRRAITRDLHFQMWGFISPRKMTKRIFRDVKAVFLNGLCVDSVMSADSIGARTFDFMDVLENDWRRSYRNARNTLLADRR